MIGTKALQRPTKGTLPHLELPCISKVLQSFTYTDLWTSIHRPHVSRWLSRLTVVSKANMASLVAAKNQLRSVMKDRLALIAHESINTQSKTLLPELRPDAVLPSPPRPDSV